MRSGRAAQLGDAEEVECLLDPLAHDVGRQAELLHRVRELFLDSVGDEPGERILADVADRLGHVAGLVLACVATVDDHSADEVAAGEVGHQAVERAEQRRLARARRPDHQAELTLVDREVDVAQHGLVASRVCERVDARPDHATAAISMRAPAGSRSARSRGGGAIHAGSAPIRIASSGSTCSVGQ